MSKSIPIALAANLDSAAPTVAYALRITRTDGVVFGFTSSGRSALIDGVAYDAAQGLDISSIVTGCTFEVDNLELSTADDGSVFTHADIISGVWQGAAFLVFRYNWAAPANGVEDVIAGTIGQVKLTRGVITAELRGLQQYLQQPIGNHTSRTCRARFADYPRANANNRCRLAAADWTDACTVGAVVSRRQFGLVRDGGAAARGDGWYVDGIVTFTAVPQQARSAKVAAFAGGVVTLTADLPELPVSGAAVTALAGCLKRLQEDCHAKFDNALNFQGEPHRPGVDALTSAPVAEA